MDKNINDVAPCKNCENRVLGCHSTCKIYVAWRYAKDRQNAKIHAKKHFESVVEGYEYKK